MTADQDGDVEVRRKSINSALGRFTLVLGACLLSTGACAAGPSNRSHMPQLRTFLASSNALSEEAMARQTGTGLQPPAIVTNDLGAGPRVQLWDELKIGPLMMPATSGATTGGNTVK
jgi:hypothetical protein